MSDHYESTVIRHREYIEDVLAGTGTPSVFTIQSYANNPGQSATFPWLSVVAQNFLFYKFISLSYEFVSTSATSFSSSTNIALGQVLARNEADPTVPVDSNLVQMLNSVGAEQEKPANHWFYPVALAKDRMDYYTVRTGAQPANTDLRMYDGQCGYFEIATNALPQAGVDVGMLFVNYEVVFYKPYYIAGLIGQTIRTAHYASGSGTSDFTNASPLGVSVLPTASGTDLIGCTITGTTITFPQAISVGSYMINFFWNAATGAAITFPTFTANAQCTIRANGSSPNVPVFGTAPHSASAETASWATFSLIVIINAPGNTTASITLGGAGTLPTGASKNCGIYVTQVNPLTN